MGMDDLHDNPPHHQDVNRASSEEAIPLGHMDFLVNAGHMTSFAAYLEGVTTPWRIPTPGGNGETTYGVLHLNRVLQSEKFQKDRDYQKGLLRVLRNEVQQQDVRQYKESLDFFEGKNPNRMQEMKAVFEAQYEKRVPRMQVLDVFLTAAETQDPGIAMLEVDGVSTLTFLRSVVDQVLRTAPDAQGRRTPYTFDEALAALSPRG